MRVDRLEQAEHDPHVHGQNVQIAGKCGPDDRTEDGADP